MAHLFERSSSIPLRVEVLCRSMRGERVPLGAKLRTKALVGYLAVQKKRAISRDMLAAVLWPNCTDAIALGHRERLAALARTIGLRVLADSLSREDLVETNALAQALLAHDPFDDAALVVVDRSEAATRYRFLEPIRDYAATRLSQAAEANSARRRHAEAVLLTSSTAG